MILLFSISCSDLNGRVDGDCADGIDDAGSFEFEFNNVLSFVIQNKL